MRDCSALRRSGERLLVKEGTSQARKGEKESVVPCGRGRGIEGEAVVAEVALAAQTAKYLPGDGAGVGATHPEAAAAPAVAATARAPGRVVGRPGMRRNNKEGGDMTGQMMWARPPR